MGDSGRLRTLLLPSSVDSLSLSLSILVNYRLQNATLSGRFKPIRMPPNRFIVASFRPCFLFVDCIRERRRRQQRRRWIVVSSREAASGGLGSQMRQGAGPGGEKARGPDEEGVADNRLATRPVRRASEDLPDQERPPSHPATIVLARARFYAKSARLPLDLTKPWRPLLPPMPRCLRVPVEVVGDGVEWVPQDHHGTRGMSASRDACRPRRFSM